MNVYDFDKTIYKGDSTVDFFWFVLRRRPTLIRFLPRQAWGFIRYAMRTLTKTQLKERFFVFLSAVDADTMAEEFWKHHCHKVYAWYLSQQQEDDIVISASPRFLLSPICRHLGIRHLIASEVDPHSGCFKGENCRGEEKARRLMKEYDVTHIDHFYSDSLSDLPLARMATKAFLVVDGQVQEWN